MVCVYLCACMRLNVTPRRVLSCVSSYLNGAPHSVVVPRQVDAETTHNSLQCLVLSDCSVAYCPTAVWWLWVSIRVYIYVCMCISVIVHVFIFYVRLSKCSKEGRKGVSFI